MSLENTTEFREITSESEQVRRYLSQNFEVWGSPFTLEEWVLYNEKISTVLAKHGLKNRVFGLFNGNDLVAACGVLDRPLYIGGEQVQAIDHAIMGVHTPREHRRKGYAQMLIDGVVSFFKNNNRDQLSLWSDVGDFYARSGFHNRDGDDFTSLVVDLPASLGSSNITQIEWIDTPDRYEEIREIHNTQLKQKADRSGEAVIEAGPGVYEMDIQKSILFQKIRNQKEPTKFGARLGDSWVTWNYLFGNGLVLILGVEGQPEQVAELLRLAVESGNAFGMTRLELFKSTLDDVDFQQVADACNGIGLKVRTETPRKGMHPMNIGKSRWRAAGGYAWC